MSALQETSLQFILPDSPLITCNHFRDILLQGEDLKAKINDEYKAKINLTKEDCARVFEINADGFDDCIKGCSPIEM